MKRSIVRVLVVDDFEPWRRFVCLKLQVRTGLNVVAEASDGLDAVDLAQRLQPDLILLDLGLPRMNGIEVARKMRRLSPNSKLLFLSQVQSRDVVVEALRTGALGYVVKSEGVRELLPAVDAVLDGRRFVSAIVGGSELTSVTDVYPDNHPGRDKLVAFDPCMDVEKFPMR